MNVHAGISFAAALSNLFLGLYVFGMNPKERLNRRFLLGLILLATWCTSEGVMRLASSQSQALLWTRATFLISSWLPFIFLYFVFHFTGKRAKWSYFFAFPPLFFDLILGMDFFFGKAFFLSGVTQTSWGFFDEIPSFGYYLYILYLNVYFAAGLWMLFRAYQGEKRQEDRRRYYYVLLSAPLPILVGGVSEFLMDMGWAPGYPIASLATLSFLILFFGARFQAKLFSPQPEDLQVTEPLFALEEKMSFLVFGENARDVFVDSVNHGHEGLLITSMNPEEREASYALRRTSVIYLSFEEGAHVVAPDDLGRLAYYIGAFLREGTKCIIFIDDVQLLIDKNGFNHTLRFLHSVSDLVVIHSAILLLKAREDMLGDIHKNLLLREFVLLRERR